MIGILKRAARRLVERSLVPHLDAQVAQIERVVADRVAANAPAGPPPDPILLDFNHRLHELRTVELRSLPINGGTLLSAGCAGLWYFDWLEQAAGPFERHIGVELYSPQPFGLASNVEWIAESASSMPGVPDGIVDVVFSGQNLEHLWIDDFVGFLVESHRVLRDGGTLVVDSPNRLATEALDWVHPEHTIELTAAEATTIFDAAGFKTRVVRGLWNCRDRSTREWLPLIREPGNVAELVDRAVGRRDIDDDFVWWIEAERTADLVDAVELRARVTDLFDQHWNGRVNRGATGGESGVRSADGSWLAPVGASGVVYRTFGFPLFPGRFEVGTHSRQSSLRIRLIRPDGTEIVSSYGTVSGELNEVEFGVCVELVAEQPLSEPTGPLSVVVVVNPM